MANDSNLNLSPQRLKHFLIHCSLAANRIERKKELKQDISGRIHKIRQLSSSQRGRPNKDVMLELEKLEKQVASIIDFQIKERTQREQLMKKLEEKMNSLNAPVSAKPLQDFERISARLQENAIKLNKIGAAEERIEKEIKEENSEIGEIEERLKSLEERYKRLSKLKSTKKSDLQRIKSIIDKHKKTLNEIKSK